MGTKAPIENTMLIEVNCCNGAYREMSVDGIVQDRSNSIAKATELLQYCIKSSIDSSLFPLFDENI